MTKDDYPNYTFDTDEWLNGQYYGAGDYLWEVQELWEAAKRLPVYEVPLIALCTDHSLWAGCDTYMEFVRHCKLVHKADLKYPILLDPDGNLADGRHRLAKAIMLGKRTIKIRRFISMPDPSKVYVDGEAVPYSEYLKTT